MKSCSRNIWKRPQNIRLSLLPLQLPSGPRGLRPQPLVRAIYLLHQLRAALRQSRHPCPVRYTVNPIDRKLLLSTQFLPFKMRVQHHFRVSLRQSQQALHHPSRSLQKHKSDTIFVPELSATPSHNGRDNPDFLCQQNSILT
jgi:hypothetical protein